MTIKSNAGPFRYTICSICGKQYIKQPSSIYKVMYKGKTNNCCSYTCYRTALRTKEEAIANEKKNKARRKSSDSCVD